jgi:hypothetical protein
MDSTSPSIRRRHLLWAGIAVGVLPLSGCAGLLAQLSYIAGGALVEPEYKGLEEQKVAVVCVSDSSSYGIGNEGELLSRGVAKLLQQNVKEIKVIEWSKVADWIDRNWNEIDYREVGRGVKADRVVAIDLKGFRIHEGSVLFKGRADLTVAVYDMTQDGREVYRRDISEFTFPVNSHYHATETSENRFRRQFLAVLSREVAKRFYPYEINEDFGGDPTFVGN